MKSVDEQPLISVIVPVFKVEQYLDRCVESIVNQTYKNLEIILVDDGSPDNCPQMCDAWAEKDNRIKVIHKPNGGLSDARNAGMAVAVGEYIAFTDSDDWVDSRYIELLYCGIKQCGATLSACGVSEVYSMDKCKDIVENVDVSCWDAEGALSTLLRGQTFKAVAWNKLYHRSLLEGMTFPVGKLHEDEFFTYLVIDKCEKLAFVNCDLYYYFQRENSIMSTVSSKHIDALEAGALRLDFLKEKYPRLYKFDKSQVCISYVNYYIAFDDLPLQERTKCQTVIKDYRKKVKFSIKEFLQLNFKQKVYVIFSRCCLGAFSKALKLLGR